MVQEPIDQTVPVHRLEPAKSVSWLTSEQIRRIKAYRAVLAEVERSSLEETIEDFGRDRNADLEITLWEQIASVYEAEVNLRPDADLAERRLLFKVILQCSLSATLDNIAAAIPNVRDLPHWGRVWQRFQLGIS